MQEIALGVGVFTAVVMALSLVILGARSWLMPSGDIAVTVNDARTIEAPAGAKLLAALADAGIDLPAACGGRGTCGLCRVTLVEGGGPALPVETSRIAGRDIAQGVRLACQVTLREDLRVVVPDEVLGAREWVCTVRSNDSISTLIKELVLDLPAGEAMDYRAGAFVQITAPPHALRFADLDIAPAYRDVWDELDLWRLESRTGEPTTRAYSLASYPEERDRLLFNIRIALPPPGAPEGTPPGIVSSYLFALKPGDQVTVSGPYGHFFARESDREMVFIGGGAGMAPMRSHILDQLLRLKSTRKISFWYGARSRRELFYVEEFDRLAAEHENFQWFPALSEPRPEDEWQGQVGFIHQVVRDAYLAGHPAPEDCEYYLCGPPVMLHAVLGMLDELGVEEESILYDDFGG